MENSKKTRVAINGFGRIGRLSFRRMFSLKNIEIVAINDLTDTKTLAHLLKYDSSQGRFLKQDKLIDVSHDDKNIIVNKNAIPVYCETKPELLPWKKLNVDIVLECTGRFASKDKANAHLIAGAKKVLISAPAGNDVPTIVYNVNHDIISKKDNIISAASCTTNALAPMVAALEKNFGIQWGLMNTIHGYTADQRIQDAPHSDLRRARAAAFSIVPTTTGAAKAIGLVIPSLKGKLHGLAMRVPVITGSVIDLTVVLKKNASVEKINAAVKKFANKNESFLYQEDLIVSCDVIGDTHGSVFDPNLTMEIESAGKKSFKVFSWYDNEYSYTCQLIRVVEYLTKLL
ncbi:MAG: type I glyceraldehyde-3-phosphate dehydrogenase [Mycoplasmoidaceae bacterium]